MNYQRYEPLVLAYARRFKHFHESIDDLEQIGRIAVWRVLTEKPDASESYIAVTIKNAMLSTERTAQAQKRRPRGRLTSLDAAFSGDDTRTLADVIGKEDAGYTLQIELLDTLLAELKRRYGYHYVTCMQNTERYPRQTVRRITRGLIEDIAKIEKKDIPKRVNFQLFKDTGLERMLWIYYNNSPFQAVMDAYQDEFLPWDFRRKPQNFWKGRKGMRNVQKALRWFCNAKGITDATTSGSVSADDFVEKGLGYVIDHFFQGSPFLALQTVYPELQPWQMQRVPSRFYTVEKNQRTAVTSFLLAHGIPPLEELSPEETYDLGLRLVVTKQSLSAHGLRGLLLPYKGSPYDLFRTLYPRQILPWTLVGKKQWKENPRKTAGTAVRWLFDTYLRIGRTNIPEYATFELFRDVGFGGIITNRNIGFNSSPFAAVDNAYPGTFRHWQFERTRRIKKIKQKGFRKPRKRSV